MATERTPLPTIALLGATGNCGRETLRTLLAQNCYADLRIYVRSAQKLGELFPGIETRTNVQLFVGPVGDQRNMERCLAGASVIISTLGSNDFYASTVLRESATTILAALKVLQQRAPTWQRPRMLVLSSATWNERFAATRPALVDGLVKAAFRAGYDDLRAAEALLARETALLSLLRVQPGLLVVEEGTGYEISAESVRLAASYPDLGAAFVQLATERSYDALSQVGVSSAGGDRFLRYAPIIFSRILGGLYAQHFPGAYVIRQFVSRLFG